MGRIRILSHLVVPLVVFVAAIVMIEHFDLDRSFENRFYDASAGVWPHKHDELLEDVLHDGGRDVIAVIGLGAMIVWIVSRFRPGRVSNPRAALYLFLAIGLSTGVVAGIKQVSARPCPWSTSWYGGSIPHAGLFEARGPGIRQGRCLPAAHASAGFSLFALYFLARRRGRIAAAVALGAGFATGLLFMMVQVVRGAHFLSHGLWSAMLCWLVCLALYVIPFHERLGEPSRDVTPDGELSCVPQS